MALVESAHAPDRAAVEVEALGEGPHRPPANDRPFGEHRQHDIGQEGRRLSAGGLGTQDSLASETATLTTKANLRGDGRSHAVLLLMLLPMP
jgi:hypothetical protein